jgi:hypothetical protein
VVANNTVFHDKDHPSHINLPVMPLDALNRQVAK